MQKNIFNPNDSNEILDRLDDLTPSNQKVEGSLNLQETLNLLSNHLLLAKGEKESEDRGSFIHHTVIKKMALWGIPFVQKEELPELEPETKNTLGDSIEDLKGSLIQTISEMTMLKNKHNWGTHPIFGSLTRIEWGRLMYLHLDNHLKHFGA